MLFFIERDELDIHDIPIAQITNDFLAYIKQLEDLNIDVASEFILVAATLMKIKARMLIPRKELDEEGNEIDPRMELAQRLLEYKRYKGILDEMKALEAQRAKREKRGYIATELKHIATKALVDVELESLTLYRLLQTFHKLMDQQASRENKQVHHIVKYSYTIRGQQRMIRERLAIGKRTNFTTLFDGLENRVHAIVTFLALLEMLNLQMLNITQGSGTNNFWITPTQAAGDGRSEEE